MLYSQLPVRWVDVDISSQHYFSSGRIDYEEYTRPCCAVQRAFLENAQSLQIEERLSFIYSRYVINRFGSHFSRIVIYL